MHHRHRRPLSPSWFISISAWPLLPLDIGREANGMQRIHDDTGMLLLMRFSRTLPLHPNSRLRSVAAGDVTPFTGPTPDGRCLTEGRAPSGNEIETEAKAQAKVR